MRTTTFNQKASRLLRTCLPIALALVSWPNACSAQVGKIVDKIEETAEEVEDKVREGGRKIDPTKILRNEPTKFHGANDIITVPTFKLRALNAKDFKGWYLDCDGHATPQRLGKWTVARNLMLTREDGITLSAENSGNGTFKIRAVEPTEFSGWYLDIDGHAKSEPFGSKWTIAKNSLMLTKEDGVEWKVKPTKSGVKLRVNNVKEFPGWYLDVGEHASVVKKGKWTTVSNLMLTKEDGVEWTGFPSKLLK